MLGIGKKSMINIKDYQSKINKELEKYFAKKIKQFERIDPLAKGALKLLADFTMQSGKRIRAINVCAGYLAAGGKDEKAILEASISIELIHSFLLIHDDIIDRDKLRRGSPTIHRYYENLASRLFTEAESSHIGASMAIVLGDISCGLAYEILSIPHGFPTQNVLKAINKVEKILRLTASGEMLDIMLSAKKWFGDAHHKEVKEEEILKIYQLKTASYTTEGPLYIGCYLAGGNKAILKALSEYGVPLGVAFQIQDEILDIFGDPQKLGKPLGSDLRERKMTILLLKSLRNAPEVQKTVLKSMFGQSKFTPKDIKKAREIFTQTHALAYSKKLIEKLIAQAKKKACKPCFKKKGREFLLKIADWIAQREY